MSSKLYKRGQLKWFKIGFRVIANICQQKLNSKEYAEITVTDDPEEDQEDGESITFTNGKAASKKDGRKTKKSREEFLIKIENRNRKRDRIKWRLGLNLYKCCEHYDAYALLEYIASGGFTGVKEREEGRESPIDVRSDVHLYTARCCNELYLLTKNHYHLEAGYRHYKNCIETMGADLSTMFKLPKVLYEFAGLLESYGAFESALQLYSRLLTNFPTFRGYFDTMYRTAIVGKVLAERVSDQKGKDEMLNKCIDIYQFLLEAVPPSINETHLVLMYAKSLEISSDASLRYRAAGAYQALHTICKNSSPPIAHANKFGNFKEWYDDPVALIELADKISSGGEPLIAKNGYESFTTRMEELKGRGKPAANITAEHWLRVAENYTQIQNYEDAVKCAEMGLKVDRLHKPCRDFLSKTSPVHRLQFEKEVKSFNFLGSKWLERCWTTGFTKKYKSLIVNDLEEKLESNNFDGEVRRTLAYYAKDKWRAKFLFENACAFRIQQCFREAKKRWQWQAPIRMKYTEYASSAYRAFLKNPLDKERREEVLRIVAHKFCPKKHAINKLIPIFEKQANAIKCVRKSFKSFRLRLGIIRRIIQRKSDKELKKIRAIVMIQTYVRRTRIKRKVWAQIRDGRHREMCAVRIALFIYRSRQNYQSSPARMLRMANMRLQQAASVLTVCMAYHIRKRIKERLRVELHLKRIAIEAEEQRKEYLRERFYIECANRIQRIVFRFIHQQHSAAYKAEVLSKNVENLSKESESTLKMIVNDTKSQYKSPGIRQNSEQFMLALQQSTIYCNCTFNSTDCLMLSSLIRHKGSKITRIIFHDVNANLPTFEFDLLPAIYASKSLKSVLIFGGEWNGTFLLDLVRGVQIENPRVTEISIENVPLGRRLSIQLCSQVGLLVSDYFNYSVPGLSNLSLHGLKLQDFNIKSLADALQLNSSLRYIHLSSNLFENQSFQSIFKSISTNPKSSVIYIDFTGNFITFNKECRRLCAEYRSVSKLKVLRIILNRNPIIDPYDPSPENFQCLQIITPQSSEPKNNNYSSSPEKFKLSKKGKKSLSRAVAAFQGTWMSPEK